jgi:hypothetical protein
VQPASRWAKESFQAQATAMTLCASLEAARRCPDNPAARRPPQRSKDVPRQLEASMPSALLYLALGCTGVSQKKAMERKGM